MILNHVGDKPPGRPGIDYLASGHCLIVTDRLIQEGGAIQSGLGRWTA